MCETQHSETNTLKRRDRLTVLVLVLSFAGCTYVENHPAALADAGVDTDGSAPEEDGGRDGGADNGGHVGHIKDPHKVPPGYEKLPDGAIVPLDDGGALSEEDGGSDSPSQSNSCETPLATCEGSCLTDVLSCGKCQKACPGGMACVAGNCTLPECQWTSFSGHDYFVCPGLTPASAMSFSQARELCQTLDLDLAIIGSSQEDSFISASLTSGWVGASDLRLEGDWTWIVPNSSATGPLFWQGVVDGAAQNGAFTHWAVDQPNARGTIDNCLKIKNGEWWDEPCTNAVGFVCESY